MRPADTDDWYGMTFYDLDLTAMMFGFFAFWAFIGAWRVLRQSLLYKDMPWVWLLFIVTTSLFMNGFTIKEEEYFRGLLYWPLLITAATMLLACMNEANDSIRYHSFSQKLAAGRHAEAFREVPLWMISFVLFSVTIIINIFMAGSGKAGIVASMGLSVWVLIVRDLLVFHAISWRPNVRRPILGMVIYMVLMYTLLPSVAGSVSDEGKLLFFPLVADFDPEHRDIVSSVYWLSMALQISVAAFFFFRAWRRSFVGVKA